MKSPNDYRGFAAHELISAMLDETLTPAMAAAHENAALCALRLKRVPTGSETIAYAMIGEPAIAIKWSSLSSKPRIVEVSPKKIVEVQGRKKTSPQLRHKPSKAQLKARARVKAVGDR